jgi:argininosuccinate lyase
MLAGAYRVVNKNPLGSGAGYGSSFPLNRQMTTDLLGFDSLHYNVVYAQMSRVKRRRSFPSVCPPLLLLYPVWPWTAVFTMNQNFDLFHSLMSLRQAAASCRIKNPDVFELIRGRSNRIQSIPNELTFLLNNLPSVTTGHAADEGNSVSCTGRTESCIDMMILMLSHTGKKDILQDEKYKYLFSVEAVNELVNQGTPFREAYKTIGNQINEGKFSYDQTKPLQHRHEGSLGNLNLADITAEMTKVLAKF